MNSNVIIEIILIKNIFSIKIMKLKKRKTKFNYSKCKNNLSARKGYNKYFSTNVLNI